MNELKCYFVGLIPQGSEDLQLATPVRPDNLAVSFTESLGEFFFDFAEKHFHCEQGDEIVLLSASVDCSDLNEGSFVEEFKKKSKSSLSIGSAIIKRRIALASDSEDLSIKVRENLYKTHRLILQAREGV